MRDFLPLAAWADVTRDDRLDRTSTIDGQGLVVIWSDVEAKMAHYDSEVGVCCVSMIALPDS
jgi:hypothetical protein